MSEHLTQLGDLLGDLDAGVFGSKVAAAISDVALGCVETRRKGKVILTFDLSAIGDSASQVQVAHQVKYVKPTKRGRLIEENTTVTPLHVGPRGKLTLFPETQADLFRSVANNITRTENN